MRRAAVSCAVISLVSLAACDDLLSVDSNPNIVDAGVAGTLQETMVGASVELYRAVDEAISHAGLYGDEFVSASTGPLHRRMGARQVTAEAQQGSTGSGRPQSLGGGFYIPLQRLLAVAHLSQERILNGDFPQTAPSDDVAQYARLAFYEGLAKLYLADLYCTVAFYGTGPEYSSDQAYEQAVEHFTHAIDAGQVEPAVRDAALVMRARARLILGDDAGAAADAALVDPEFEFNVGYSTATFEQRNRIHVHTYDVGDWSIAPRFRQLTIDDTEIEDPRTLVEGPAQAFDASQELWVPLKYPVPASPIRIASGDEARYILAEVAGGQTAVNMINEVRARHGIPTEWMPTGGLNEIRDKLIDERARTLFLEGTHLGDLRRYMNKYGLDLFPTENPHGIEVGNQTCMPMPAIERDNNPDL
ncbi:MAG: RagB/SusD family nutrient uptake outer membrane protein [Gemmatimonadota bacterium]